MDRAYDALAPWYDRIRLARPGELAWWESLARDAGGGVLEIGCGTGLVLEALSRGAGGRPAWGIDASPAMLDLARARMEAAGLAARLTTADMRTFDLGRRFALVALPYRTFQHLTMRVDQVTCLERVRAHLGPGGRLALDVGGADLAAAGATPLRHTREERIDLGGGETLDTTLEVEIHPVTALGRQRRTIRRGSVELARAVLEVRYLATGEMEGLLHAAGFRITGRWGGFLGEPVRPGGDTLWLAEV